MEYNWTHPEIGQQQLNLNLTQLNSKQAYPPHWHELLKCLETLDMHELTFYDIGCEVGSTYKLLVDNHLYIDYVGIDISESMIELAKKTWNYSKFKFGDINSLELGEMKDQIIYCSAVFEVMTNGLQGLHTILSAGAKYVIVNREHIEQTSSVTTYYAYNTIPCAKYVFAKDEYEKALKEYGYIEEIKIGDCRVLKQTSSA